MWDKDGNATGEYWAKDENGLDEAWQNGPLKKLHIGTGIPGNRLLHWLDWHGGVSERVDISEGHPTLRSINGIIYSSDGKELLFCPGRMAGSIEIPEGVERVKKKAFEGVELDSLVFPSTIKTIEDGAFGGPFGNRCKIGKASFRDGIKRIGEGAFNGADIRRVELPQSLVGIDGYAFRWCGIESVKLNDGLSYIGKLAFDKCKIEEIDIPPSVQAIGEEAFDGYILRKATVHSTKAAIELMEAAAIIWEHPQEPGYLEYTRKPFLLDINGDKFAIPLEFVQKESVRKRWRMFGIGRGAQKKLRHLYVDAIGTPLKEETALASLMLYPDDKELQKYVAGHAASMAERYLKENDADGLLALMRTGRVDRETAKMVLEKAKDGAARAYAMEILEIGCGCAGGTDAALEL